MIIDYPIHLLPKKEYKIITICKDDEEHHLGRWVDAQIPLKDEDGILNAGAIDIKRLPNLSTNKIPDSKSSDLKIAFIGNAINKYQSDWVEGMEVESPKSHEFEIINDRGIYFIPIGKIHNYSDTYYNPIVPEEKKKKLEFKLEITHKPLIANYWHFEFTIFANGDKLKYTSGKWAKVLCSAIRDRIQQIAVFDIN